MGNNLLQKKMLVPNSLFESFQKELRSQAHNAGLYSYKNLSFTLFN